MGRKTTNGDLYHTIIELWKKANSSKTPKFNNEHFLKWWQEYKEDRDAIVKKIQELKLKIAGQGKPILQAFLKFKRNDIATESAPSVSVPEVLDDEDLKQAESPLEEYEQKEDVLNLHKERETPAQNKIQQHLSNAEKELNSLIILRDSGFPSPDNLQRIKELRGVVKDKNKKLAKLQAQQKHSKQHREKLKSALLQLKETEPAAAKILQKTGSSVRGGRPRLESNQVGLMDTILNIVKYSSSADEKRRSETLRTCKTLDQLLQQLRDLGYQISRSGLYVRLLPRNFTTREGKRHTVTVPVKLVKAQNTARKAHQDTHFAAATVKYLRNLAVVFGSRSVCVLSQDDKAKVPLGLPAAKKQAPILMRMEYRVELPDHDFVVASRHKLTPSVYAGLQIIDGRVTYSGPTYIAIRSMKHDSSTAPRHADDLRRLVALEEFKEICHIRSCEESVPSPEPVPYETLKPIWILLVDGGPDEGPRYPKTLKYAALNFIKMDLDAMFVATHAPGQSASNPVERRMAPLSRDLCGIVLPYETFGKHLDNSGKTIDLELEKANFQKAGELLADVWSERVIDKFPVVSEYVHPGSNTRSKITRTSGQPVIGADSDSNESDVLLETLISSTGRQVEDDDIGFMTELWKSRHVRQSQYLLQIVKCEDVACCKLARTNIREFLRDQFIPAPIPVLQTNSGLKLATLEDKDYHFQDLLGRLASEFLLDFPLKCFDKYCPSSQNKITDLTYTCVTCGSYFVTKEALKTHKKVHAKSTNLGLVQDDVDFTNEDDVIDDGIVFIDNMEEWLAPIFIELSESAPR